jgi:hypothetical protein
VESGEWRVESGEWRVESGEWRVESGEWRVESEDRRCKAHILRQGGPKGRGRGKVRVPKGRGGV